MEDLIDRQAAIDALKDMYQAAEKWGQEAKDDVIKVRAESCMASLVEMKLRIEKLPSAQPEEDCNTCKHGDFGGRQCDNCCVRYPSHYERKEDGIYYCDKG